MTLYLSRRLHALGFLACVVLIGVALYFQYVEYLEPCPLCIVQRLIVIAIGVVFLIAAIHNPAGWGRRIYDAGLVVLSVLGAAVAGRHVWLQNLPLDQVPECGPGLEFLLKRFTLDQVLHKVLSGSGECAEVVWSFLGLSIPGWTLVAFSGLAILSLVLLFSSRRW